MGLNSLAGASVSFYNSVVRCLPSRRYERLREKRRNRVRVWKLGGQKRRSGAWRLRAVPKLRFRWACAKTLLAKLRDSYVNMMMSMSSSTFFSSRAMSNNLGMQCTSIVKPFGRVPSVQLDENNIREMYKPAVQLQASSSIDPSFWQSTS